LPTRLLNKKDSYFRECLAAGSRGVRVVRRDGSVDLIAGNCYLEYVTVLRDKDEQWPRFRIESE
jgi:hypothetical protein